MGEVIIDPSSPVSQYQKTILGTYQFEKMKERNEKSDSHEWLLFKCKFHLSSRP